MINTIPIIRHIVLVSLLLICDLKRAAASEIVEGGEYGLNNVTVQVPAGYNILSNTIYGDSAPRSFHFTHPGNADQWMMLNSAVVPQAGSELRFKSMLRWATPGQIARAQLSTNNGATWANVWNQAGNSTGGEAVFGDKVVSLSAYVGQSLRIRFIYSVDNLNSGVYGQTTDIAGWFLDDIKVSNIIIQSTNRPNILSSLVATGAVGNIFNYQIVGSNNPTSYSATGLPPGLSINTTSGIVSGTPTTPATTNVTIGAANAIGTTTATLVVTISAFPTLFEGAENGLTNVTVQVPAGYNILSNTIYGDSAPRSFHFTHPGNADQWMLLNSAVVPQAGSELRFKSMLRWATPGQIARAQLSTNNGATWANVWSQAGNSTGGEAVFGDKVVSLSAYVGQSLRIRFIYAVDNLNFGVYGQTTDIAGWFLDDIKVSNVIIGGSPSPVNNAPAFTKGSNQTVIEDAGLKTVVGWATNISAGPAGEAAQTLNFIVTNNNNVLFSAQPAITANGTLTYTPAPNANGSATVTVQLRDNGGTANGGVDTSVAQTFVINITPINDPPVALPQTLAVVQGSLTSDTVEVINVDAPESLTYSIATQPTSGAPLMINSATGLFTYTPIPTAEEDSFAIKVTDSGGLSSTATVSVSIEFDSEGDGLPDAWEMSTFGNLGKGAAVDSDGDGQTNLQEYIAGTNAASGSSTFSATVAPISESECELIWPSVPGRVYAIKRATGVGSTWTSVAENIPAATGVAYTRWTVTESSGVSQMFYRVEVRVL